MKHRELWGYNKYRQIVHRYLKSVDTQWWKRTRMLTTKHRITGANTQPGAVKKKVKETVVMWAERMETKVTAENFYDSTKGSALLFEARACCLRTRTCRNK